MAIGREGELRQLLGKAVRTQAEQQREMDSMFKQLREQQTLASNAHEMARVSGGEAAELRAQLRALRLQLETEQVRLRCEARAPLSSPFMLIVAHGTCLLALAVMHAARSASALKAKPQHLNARRCWRRRWKNLRRKIGAGSLWRRRWKLPWPLRHPLPLPLRRPSQ